MNRYNQRIAPVAVACAVTLGLLSVAVAATDRAYEGQIASNQAVLAPQSASASIRTLTIRLRDCETAQQRYLLTRDTAYFLQVERDGKPIGGDLARLKLSARSSPELDQYGGGVGQLVPLKLAELRETADLAKSGNLGAALAIDDGRRGKRLTAAIHTRGRRAGPPGQGRLGPVLESQDELMPSDTTVTAELYVATLLLLAAESFIWFLMARQARTEQRVADLNVALRFHIEQLETSTGSSNPPPSPTD